MGDLVLRTSQRQVVADSALALLVTLLLLVSYIGPLSDVPLTDDVVSLRGPGSAGLLLLMSGTMSLAFRRIVAVPVLLFNGATFLAYQWLAYRPPPLPLGLLVALFTVAVGRRPQVCAGAAAAVLIAFSLGSFTKMAPLSDDQFYTYLVSVVAIVMVGYGVQLGRARATLAERYAAELAREQQTLMRASLQHEQARIAREVHDIVAHDVSVIVAQAATARRVFDRQPQTAVQALASIEAVGRDALDGLRRLVGLLRADFGQPERSPQPGLDRLPWLLAQVERAGLPVLLTVSGEPRPLPATLELNVFRIVQEALTNTLKHAGPTRATVALGYEEGSLTVEVRDEGTGGIRVASPEGYGLLGMRQRVAMLRGELSTGPGPGRGFLVTARLPVAGGAS